MSAAVRYFSMPKRSRKVQSKASSRDANQSAFDAVQRIIELSEGTRTSDGKDPLAVARFVDALPPLKLSRDRLEYVIPDERPGVIRLAVNNPPPPPSPAPVTQVAPPAPQPQLRAAAPPPMIVIAPPPAPPPEPILETYYVAPVWTGIVIMNPPEKKPEKDPKRRGRHDWEREP